MDLFCALVEQAGARAASALRNGTLPTATRSTTSRAPAAPFNQVRTGINLHALSTRPDGRALHGRCSR
jgi:hypothetical protein